MAEARCCLACGNADMELVVDLGHQKPVNNLGVNGFGVAREELAVEACPSCGHGQLTKFLAPSLLFGDYLYASSTSHSLSSYQEAFAGVIASASQGSPLRVLEIASNDGLLLQKLRDVNVRAVGLDPAARMVQRANDLGLESHLGYWPIDAARLLANEKFCLIVGQNVLAHTPDPLRFLSAVGEYLDAGGIAIFQTSQADMVENGEFDTVYHEHYSFFCERSAKILGERAGLPYFGARYSRIHGTSAIFLFAKRPSAISRIVRILDENGQPWSEWREKLPPLRSPRVNRSIEDWRTFGRLARERMSLVKNEVAKARSRGFRVVAVGAAAKGITFLRAAEIDVDLLLDEATDKVGLEIDGLKVGIDDLKTFQPSESDFYLVTAWNFASELARKLRARGADSEAPICVYFPALAISQLKELAI